MKDRISKSIHDLIKAVLFILVEKNVIFNNMGHAIFTEDGIEIENIVQYNLAIYTRVSLKNHTYGKKKRKREKTLLIILTI